MRLLAIVVVGIVFCSASVGLAASVNVTNPSGLGTNINTLGRTMAEEVGNYTIAQFNANSNTYNHTFESANGYGSAINPNRLTSVTLTSGVSGIDLVTTYTLGGTSGFGNVLSAFYPTGGSYAACWASAGTHSATFNNPVQGVGFTVNRSYIDITIKLFDQYNSQIGPTYTVISNGVGYSFFGHFDFDAAIRKVEFTAPYSNQFSIDDFTVIVGADPDPDDYTKPTPDPITWDSVPGTLNSFQITMTATTASDTSGVEYYFEETSGNAGGSDSGWQSSRTYTDVDLVPETQYAYKVRARDKSPNYNTTGWSTTASATTPAWSFTPTSDLPDLSNITGADIDESNVSYALHVSVDGNDNNPGTLALPFRTVNKAAQVAVVHQVNDDGVKVIIHPGTYREYVGALMEDYDTPAGITAPIIFEASEPGTAILSASEIYTGWVRQGSSDIYTHSWTHNWGPFLDFGDALPFYREQKFSYNPILQRVEMFFADGQHLTQVLTYDHYVPHDDPGVTELENSFYIDEAANLVYIHLPAGSDISQMTIEAAERHDIFRASSIYNLVIRGLVFEHAANTLAIQLSPNGGRNGALYIDSSVNVLLEDNLFRWNNGTGYSFYGGYEDSPYRIYFPCDKVTVRRNVSNYNGFAGLETYICRNWIFEDNEESYNNWRGARGTWEWDNSGRGLGLFSGWTGTRFYRTHFAIIRRHKAIGNYARGIWFDYDNMHILYEDGLLHDNMHGLKFEVNPGPIWIKDTVITDNALAGMYIAVADHTTIENCTITGNGYLAGSGAILAQIYIDKDYLSHYCGVWDNIIPREVIWMGRWTMFDTVIGGPASASVMEATSLANFMDNLASEHNYWYRSSDVGAFKIDTTAYDFAGWKSQTGQDSSSTFASSAPVPSYCGDFGTTYPVADVDDDCRADFVDFAKIANIWGDDSVCDDPLIASDEDMYHDCQIDIRDIAVLANHWLEDTNP
jgi:hypothetical protein